MSVLSSNIDKFENYFLILVFIINFIMSLLFVAFPFAAAGRKAENTAARFIDVSRPITANLHLCIIRRFPFDNRPAQPHPYDELAAPQQTKPAFWLPGI